MKPHWLLNQNVPQPAVNRLRVSGSLLPGPFHIYDGRTLRRRMLP